MKKSDLRNGMVVELRDYERRLVRGDDFSTLDFMKNVCIDSYRDDLINEYENELDVMKVWDGYDLIWKRDEFDWSKVPVGTKVLVSRDNKEWVEAYYLNNCNGAFFSHYVLSSHKESTWFYEYCKLAEEQENR